MIYLDDSENRTKRGSGNEDEEETSMEFLVTFGIKYGQEDEAYASDERRDNR